MKASVSTLYRILEEWWQTIQQKGIPAAMLRDQLPGSVIPPATSTDKGGVLLSDSVPNATGTAAAGTGSSVSRTDHVHPLGAHDHTAAAGDGGTLTNDTHDGYSEYAEISAPSTPAGNKARLYAKDKSGVSNLYFKDDGGTEHDLTGSSGMTNPMTTEGDLIRGGASGTPTRVAVGASGKILTSDGTDPVWGNGPLTTRGDIITAGVAGAIQRLAIGAANTVLHGSATDPSYSAVVEADLNLTNVTTADVSITKHGFAPIAPNDVTKFLDGTGAYSTPTAGGVGGAPSTSDYWVETADAGLSAEVVVGTTGITTAAEASKQAAAKAGRLFLPSDGFYIERDTGSAWAPWGPIYPMVAPPTSSWSWDNQGSATVTTTNGGITMFAPASGTTETHVYYRTAPSTPYTITAALLWAHTVPVDFHQYGICFRQSSTGKLNTFTLGRNGAPFIIYSRKWTTTTSFSADYTSYTIYPNNLYFLRITDNGTNRILDWSMNGQTWVTLQTIGRTDFLTADQVGFHVTPLNATYPIAITLLSWAVT
jgi:hypothetical protein